jgi:hypothetical protein
MGEGEGEKETYDSLELFGIACITNLRIDSSVILDASYQF